VPRQAAEIARKALKEFDVIVAVGGDGTVNEIVPACSFPESLSHHSFRLGKRLHQITGHPRTTLKQAVDIVLKGGTRVIDAGKINGRYFANGVGIVFRRRGEPCSYEINHSKRGLWLYICALIQTLENTIRSRCG